MKEKGKDYSESADHVMTEGVSLAWNFDYGQDEKNLYITIGDATDPAPGPKPDPKPAPAQLRGQTKSLVETQLASATLIRQGPDLLARGGLDAMEGALDAARNYSGAQGYTPFVAMGGSKLRHETSSHVDIKGAETVLGFAKETESRLGKLIIAPVIEYGRGDYDSYMENSIHGDGTTEYYGAGILLKQNLGEGFYADASARFGRVKSDYASGDLDGASRVSYDLSTSYVALHAALSKVFAISGRQAAMLYAKYFHDWQNPPMPRSPQAGSTTSQAWTATACSWAASTASASPRIQAST